MLSDRARLSALRLLSRALLPKPASPPSPERIRRVLVYGGMGIGNMIMFTPALRALRDGLPSARLTLLTRDSGADQVVIGGDLIDDIVRVRGGLFSRLRLALRIRSRRFDALISSFQGDDFKLVTLLSGIPLRVGHCSSGGWKGRADFLYNVQVRMEDGEHEVDRKLRLVRAVGVSSNRPEQVPEFFISAQDRVAADKLLGDAGIVDNDVLIGLPIDVSRGQEWKRWSPERLASVCNELERRHGCRFVLLGAPDRMNELPAFLGQLAFSPVIALGRSSLKETAAILERCALTICADSGLMHVSAAVGTPALAIYGPTDYQRTSPTRYGTSHRIVRKPVECGPCFLMEGDGVVRACPHRKCLGLIGADEVVEEAEEMLGFAVDVSIP